MTMVMMRSLLLTAAAVFSGFVAAQSGSTSCQEALDQLGLEVTAEGRAKYTNLQGACEGIVEMNGEQYLTTTAVVRRASSSSVTLYLPATDHTFEVTPSEDTRVIIDGRKVRPRDLDRGQEIQINVAMASITQPQVEEVALATEFAELEPLPATPVDALPTTG